MGKCRVRKEVRESFEKAVADIEDERYGYINPYGLLEERISKLDVAIASLIDYRNELGRIMANEKRELLHSSYLSYPTYMDNDEYIQKHKRI